MAEAPFTGLTASVKIGPFATAVVIGYISGVDLTLEKDIIEILQFGATFKEKVPSISDWSASIDGTAAFASTGGQKDLYDAFISGAPITIGTYLDTDTYFEGSALVQSLKISAAPDDKVSITCELSGTGAVTFTV